MTTLVSAYDRVMGVVVLIGLVLAVNSVSISVRVYLRSRKKW